LPPIKNGILITSDQGVIVDLISEKNTDYSIQDIEKYAGIICPGFVNTHCHLELSYLKNKTPKQSGLDAFILFLSKNRKQKNELIIAAAKKAEQEMIHNGIVAVGDICNNESTLQLKAESKLFFHHFIEVFASDETKADHAFEKGLKLYQTAISMYRNNHASITPHAPYSLSPKLFKKVKAFAEEHKFIQTIHHQESEDENLFFLGSGETITERQKKFGVTNSCFYNTGKRPLKSIAEFLAHQNPMLFVHNTVSTKEDIQFAKRYFKNLYWCLCPNANIYIENKLPCIQFFLDENCKLTLGTDSLASNYQLSILEEMKTIQLAIPAISTEQLVQWATLNGAEFLNCSTQYGSFEIGKKSGINLIQKIDLKNVKLLTESVAKVLL